MFRYISHKNKQNKLYYLKSLPNDYELLLISFFVTNPEALAKLESQWSKRDATHQKYFGRSNKDVKVVSSKTFSGAICLIDPHRFDLGFISEIECPVATGMCYISKEKSLYVGSSKYIKKIKNGKIINTPGNTLFNDIHTLSESMRGNLLVTSTGIDGILEVDFNDTRKIIWEWLATEHGYSTTPTGKKRIIDRNINYQKISTVTPEHTTHINSILEYKQYKILATLFHQGELIEIDMKTKISKVLFKGMKCPHHIRKRKNGYLLSDSRNNRVILLTKNFNIARIFKNSYNWIQDTVELGNGSFIIGDSNNSRLLKIDNEGNEIDIFYIKKGTRKMFSFLPITKKEALNIFYRKT